MLMLKVLFALLALVSLACAAREFIEKQKNIGFIILCIMITVFDIMYIVLLGAQNAKSATKVLLPFYVLFAWFLPVFLLMIVLIDKIKKYWIYLILPAIISGYQTYLVISQYFGARIFSFQKRIYFRKAFWVAVDTKNTGILFSYRSYRIASYINLAILLLVLFLCVKISQKIFRARYNIMIVAMIGYSIGLSLTVRFMLPVWIVGSLLNAVSVLCLYYLNGFPKNKFRTVSLDSFANNMSDGLILYDKYNELIHINDMIKNTLSEDLVNDFKDRNKFSDWIEGSIGDGEDKIDTETRKVLITYTDDDKREYFFKVSKRDIGDERSPLGTLYILHDTTDSMNRIIAVEKMNEELERASRMKSDFLANMSHEIRTPMNAVIGMAELAIREKDTPMLTDYLLQIQNSGRNLLNIINDILDYSKIESGKMEIIEEEYEPFEELGEIANALMTRIGDKPLEFFMIIETVLPRRVIGDSMRIRQILINLANNAIKFTKEGIVRVSVKCEKISDDVMNMTYHVVDTGIGIKEEDKEKLFVSFQQVDSRRNRSVEGTGLGLAISQKLVDAMNGEIGFTSEYGKGSDFWFSVPVKIADETDTLVVEDADNKHAFVLDNPGEMADIFIGDMKRFGVDGTILQDISDYKPSGKKDFLFFLQDSYDNKIRDFLDENKDVTGVIRLEYASDFVPDKDNLKIMRKPMTTMVMLNVLNGRFNEVRTLDEKKTFKADFTAPDARVLVVDDNRINLTIAEGLMAPLKMHVDTAESGAEAIEKVKAGNYDVVLMDHMMPEIDGVDATKAIVAEGDKIHQPAIIALSANVMEEAIKLFKEAGMCDFIGKPVDIRNLTLVLKKWLPAAKIVNSEDSKEEKEEDEVILKLDGLETEKAVDALGSAILYNKVLEEYYRSGPGKLSHILDDIAKSDWVNYTIKVHALKSSSRQIGAMELGNMAEALEKAGKAGDIDTIMKENPKAMELFKDLLEALKTIFPSEEEDVGEKPLMDRKEIISYLDKLDMACEDLDLDAMEEVGNVLKSHSFDDDLKEDISSLRQTIADVDFDTCAETVKKIRQIVGD